MPCPPAPADHSLCEQGDGQGQAIGALEEAHGGTLYIDEVADMPLETQAKVLRVLLDQTFQRVGGLKKVKAVFHGTRSSIRNCGPDLPRRPLSSP